MKKLSMIILVLLLSAIVFLLGFQDKNTIVPNYFYQVYLDDEVLGIIKSKKSLEEYIDKEGTYIKEQYGVDKVYAPNGLQIKKIITYSSKVDSVKSVYKKLEKLKPFTISGYQFTIKGKDANKVIYTTDTDLFEKALENTMIAYVGKSEYQAYKGNIQEEIKTTGEVINDIYVDETIMIKNVKVSTKEKIYTDVDSLSQYILFGTTDEKEKYTVKEGDTIQKIADNNKIGVDAFLISNPELTSVDNILYNGQVVSLAVPKPSVTIISEYTQVSDQEADYQIERKQDPTMTIGDEEVIQNGEKGMNRVTSKITKTNGEITLLKPLSTAVLKPATSQIVLVGTKYQSNIAGRWWAWPTQPGWAISSNYGGRSHPITGAYSFHQAIDIYLGSWTQIYAANNGTIVKMAYSPKSRDGGNGYGNYMIVNHNNGIYTLYAHMNGFARGLKEGSTVGRGQLIGYMGTTGDATGPHLHFEAWHGMPWNGGTHFNPRSLY